MGALRAAGNPTTFAASVETSLYLILNVNAGSPGDYV